MADTLKSNFTKSNGGSERKILDGAGSNIVYTVLSIHIMNTDASVDNSFSLLMNDVDDTFGAGANSNYFFYRAQPLPASSTFIHNDKIVIKHNEELCFALDTSSTAIDICVTYLEQT